MVLCRGLFDSSALLWNVSRLYSAAFKAGKGHFRAIQSDGKEFLAFRMTAQLAFETPQERRSQCSDEAGPLPPAVFSPEGTRVQLWTGKLAS
jgi:hypothetical protein